MMIKKIKQFIHFILAWTAYWYYGRPARNLIVVGVTGTKGKSTTCRLITSVLEAGGYKVGLLSTAEFQIADKRWINDKKMTMLGRGQIQKMLKEIVKAGCQYAVVETSSEGILQYRHYGLQYDIAVFTNLGTEHIERHGSFENLKRDKGKMFSALTKSPHKILNGKRISKVIIANGDDGNASYYLSFPADEKWIYGLKGLPKSDEAHCIEGQIKNASSGGVDFMIKDQNYHLNIAGEFNVYNALAAYAVGTSQNISPQNIAQGFLNVAIVPGRMESVDEAQVFKVIVDYAHEPKSFEAVFEAIKNFKPHRIIHVFGAPGGGRDKSKRQEMGRISQTYADSIIITTDDPYEEDPAVIAHMIQRGTSPEKTVVILDRKQAIKQALVSARPGDVVLITGKGSEQYLMLKDKKIPWDDREIAREFLRELKTHS